MAKDAWVDDWGTFLTVRRRLINAWRIEGKTCTEIASILSMDPGQVWLISTVETGDPPQDAVDAQRAVEGRAWSAWVKANGGAHDGS